MSMKLFSDALLSLILVLCILILMLMHDMPTRSPSESLFCGSVASCPVHRYAQEGCNALLCALYPMQLGMTWNIQLYDH